MSDNNKKAKTRPVKQAGYNSSKLWARRDQRRLDAEHRQEKYDGLTPEQKLAKAAQRGGSKRELARLVKRQKP